ncbi:hypothetical protein JOL79_06695 [Microbispora sp. RL4-1S]|uniref:Uncharacterized protein n=1 Tax=Microbispora oryzae TaxID=2806554 RepID=A0A940WL44_9ACTN|nr:hypothetical protein [Microbispora oryzae]MBP2703485.1 hypothetical protein [Microbispora oryzae]
MAGTKCFTVEFDRGENEPKIIWADTFRLSDDEEWVDFYDADGEKISSVRAPLVLAVDRACAAPIADTPQAAEGRIGPRGVPASRQAAAGAGLNGPSSSLAAGPVEAAALAAARGGVPQQGDAAAAIGAVPGAR